MHQSVVDYDITSADKASVVRLQSGGPVARLSSYLAAVCIAAGLVSAWLGLCVITG